MGYRSLGYSQGHRPATAANGERANFFRGVVKGRAGRSNSGQDWGRLPQAQSWSGY